MNEPAVAAELERERMRKERRALRYHIPKRVAEEAGESCPRRPRQSLEQPPATVSPQPSAPLPPRSSMPLPPRSQSPAPPPRSQPQTQTRKERRALRERERQATIVELNQLLARRRDEMARLQAALKYVQAAPAEMRRHTDMAHEAAQHGDRLVSLLARTPTTMLRGQLDAALTHQVRAMRASASGASASGARWPAASGWACGIAGAESWFGSAGEGGVACA